MTYVLVPDSTTLRCSGCQRIFQGSDVVVLEGEKLLDLFRKPETSEGFFSRITPTLVRQAAKLVYEFLEGNRQALTEYFGRTALYKVKQCLLDYMYPSRRTRDPVSPYLGAFSA